MDHPAYLAPIEDPNATNIHDEEVLNGWNHGLPAGVTNDINDEELAAVLTYVRNSWGNKAPAVQPETVKKVRAATKSRTIFWKPEELLKEHPLEK